MFWILYSFFWVIPQRLNFIFFLFGDSSASESHILSFEWFLSVWILYSFFWVIPQRLNFIFFLLGGSSASEFYILSFGWFLSVWILYSFFWVIPQRLNFIFFLLGDSSASQFYILSFGWFLSVWILYSFFWVIPQRLNFIFFFFFLGGGGDSSASESYILSFGCFLSVWILYSFFCVIPQSLNFMFFLLSYSSASEFYCRCFGTTCLFHLQRWCKLCFIFTDGANTTHEDGTGSVPKRQQIKFIRRGITQKKEYNISQLRFSICRNDHSVQTFRSNTYSLLTKDASILSCKFNATKQTLAAQHSRSRSQPPTERTRLQNHLPGWVQISNSLISALFSLL
jgi:hypothetical protein